MSMRNNTRVVRKQEVVVRELVREWLISEAKEVSDVAADAASDAESIESVFDTAISSVEGMVDSDTKTLKKMAENRAIRRRRIQEKKDKKRLDEFDPVTLGLGLVASAPMIVRVLGFFLKGALKIYASLANKIGKSGHADDVNKKADIVDEWASHTYHWLHEKYIDFYELIVKAIIYAAIAPIGMGQEAGVVKEDYAGMVSRWLESDGGKKTLRIAATALDVATSSVLGAMAGTEAVNAFKHASIALGGLEGALAAMKVAHVSEAVAVSLRVAGSAIVRGLAEAGLSAALLTQAKESLKEIWEKVSDRFDDYATAAKKVVVAAGVAIAVASSTPGEKPDSPSAGVEKSDSR